VKKLGILVSCDPAHRNFSHAVGLARAAVGRGVKVYLYCIDEAVRGVAREEMQRLKNDGVVLYGCAFSARTRNLPIDDLATYTGLTIVSDLLASTDRFVSFNA
jgi:predicted peroxiredoxin